MCQLFSQDPIEHLRYQVGQNVPFRLATQSAQYAQLSECALAVATPTGVGGYKTSLEAANYTIVLTCQPTAVPSRSAM
jgi:hypothetical protein